MMLKKRSTDKTSKRGPKKKQVLRRVMEGLFLSDAGPKRGCLTYLTEIRVICHTSDAFFLIIIIKYDKHTLFGPASDKNKPSTTRREPWFFSGLIIGKP